MKMHSFVHNQRKISYNYPFLKVNLGYTKIFIISGKSEKHCETFEKAHIATVLLKAFFELQLLKPAIPL